MPGLLNKLRQLGAALKYLPRLREDVESVKLLLGQVLENANGPDGPPREFKVFSQTGQDGIMAWILGKLGLEDGTFVEFGCSSYWESNTRYLLLRRNWNGLVLDGDPTNIAKIRESYYFWKHRLRAEQAFITRENINGLIASHMPADPDLVVVDVDGNDYWIVQALEFRPRVLVVEFNSVFGPELHLTVPYDATFQRTRAHYSNLYFGASLAALGTLAGWMGYKLVWVNSGSTDAFFVRNDVAGAFWGYSSRDLWRLDRARQSRSPAGELTFVDDWRNQLQLIRDCPIVNLAAGERVELLGALIEQILSTAKDIKAPPAGSRALPGASA